MKVIYIASPYSVGDVAENVHRQIEAAHTILDMGHAPIAPNLSHFLHLHRQRPYRDWMEADRAIVAKVDIVLRLPGVSAGADEAVRLAAELGIPVAFGWADLGRMLVAANGKRRPLSTVAHSLLAGEARRGGAPSASRRPRVVP